VGFAARRDDEVLHFGTALDTWGSGLATWMHDALLATYPPDVSRIRLRVFARNDRGRRFYEKLGWSPTGAESRTSFPPHPLLLEYVLDRTAPRAAG
jgi:RimJ/RimL family protein N-acetyltransferase